MVHPVVLHTVLHPLLDSYTRSFRPVTRTNGETYSDGWYFGQSLSSVEKQGVLDVYKIAKQRKS